MNEILRESQGNTYSILFIREGVTKNFISQYLLIKILELTGQA
jgi:hypothetical protein